MTYKQINTMISSIGLPYAYYQFTEDTAQACPFIVFYYNGGNDFIADDSNYQEITELIIELYTDFKDFTNENLIKQTLNNNGLVYTWEETFLDSERMHMTVFRTEVVINGEN